jgi:diguanylate cyclase (GGDEF)-like protein/PAS domain S-box-containing protein
MSSNGSAAKWRSHLVEGASSDAGAFCHASPNDRGASGELNGVAERYRLAARATNDLIWDWDLRAGTIQWNEALEFRLGYEPGDLGTTAEWWLNRIHPEDVIRVSREVHDALDGQSGHFACEYRFLKCDGSYADIFDRGYVIRDEDGCAVRMVGAMQDNTERNRALAKILNQQAQLETVFGQAMVGIMHTGADRKVLMVNARYCDILGRTEEQLTESNIAEFTHPDDVPWNVPLLEQHWSSGEPFQIEKRYLRPDGSMVWCEVSVSFVRDSRGVPTSSIVVAQDITARKAAEAQAAEKSSLLQNVIDGVADLIFVKDLSGKFILANRALNEGCGPLVGARTTDLLPEDLTLGYESVDHAVIRTGERRCIDEEIPIKGERRLFETLKAPWICDGQIAGVIGVSRDITEQQKAAAAIRESELLYRSVLNASVDCIKIIDLDGHLQLMNEPGQKSIGLDDFDTLRGVKWASIWPSEGKPLVEAALDEARNGQVSRFSGMVPTFAGDQKWWDVLVSPMCDDDGSVTSILAISRDITVQRKTSEQLKWASEHDSLTTLPNRRAFQARLQAATIRAMDSGVSVGLLLIDLDHFKHINDTLGHAAGDHLLASFGKRLKESLRSGDFVARLGGDEFAVIVEGAAQAKQLVSTGEAILKRLKHPITFGGHVMSTGASIGGALFPTDAQCANGLFNNADSALYALKKAGRGGMKMFHQHMRQQAQQVASQLSLARSAISAESVEPHYQQKIELGTGKVKGFEALLRWRHPSRGIQQPDTVAEAFKNYELASKIGELMQRRVFSDMRRWREKGLNCGIVAINAAPAEFMRDDFAEQLLSRLEQFSVPASALEIEVTEHVFFDRASHYVSRALRVLNAAGASVALDDFGTGYSSLSHLRDFPVDVVKIDQSFVAKMVRDPEVKAIVSAVIDLARNLKMQVVAEGVETVLQQDMLREMRCLLAQGHLFGRAIHADEVPHLIRR